MNNEVKVGGQYNSPMWEQFYWAARSMYLWVSNWWWAA